MSFSNTFETDLLSLIFTNADITTIGDAGGLRGSVAAGSLYLALHTADPGEAGTQITSEAAYTGYARVAVARSAGQWSVTSPGGTATVTNLNAISWPSVTAAPATMTWVSVGTAASGAGKILARYQITVPSGGQALVIGAIPTIAASQMTLTLD